MRRRSLLQELGASAAGVGLLTGSAAAETHAAQSGVYYEITGDKSLRYCGPDTNGLNPIKTATNIFNAGKERGDWSFRLPNDRVQVISNATGSPRIQSAGACSAKSKYENGWTSQGFRHTFWFNDSQCDELRNKLHGGAQVAAIAGAISAYYVNPTGVAVSAVAHILCKFGRDIIDMNNEGSGIKLWFHAPNIWDFDIYEVRSQ